tara:strand:- start:209 stop:646 length:438 start_codon:yes stop_codon:yes gene_type:complete
MNVNKYLNLLDFNNNNKNNYDTYSDNNLLNKPNLVELKTKKYLNNILLKCNNFKYQYYTYYYNLIGFIIFFTILGIILFFRYKGFNIDKRKENILRDKNYIMSKLVYYNKNAMENSKKISNNLITNLPDYSNHPEASILHKNIFI